MLKNTRQEAFAQALAKGMSATAAYAAAGYRPHDGNAARLSGNERVRARVAELTAGAIAKTGLTAERILDEQSAIAFANIFDYLEKAADGELLFKDPRTLPANMRAAISHISVTGAGKSRRFQIKLHDKQRAIETLMRHMQMFKDNVVVENVFQVVKEMSDEELNRRIADLQRAEDEAKGGTRH